MGDSDKIRTCWPRFNLRNELLAPNHNHNNNQQLWLTKRSAQARKSFASMAYFTCDDACHV